MPTELQRFNEATFMHGVFKWAKKYIDNKNLKLREHLFADQHSEVELEINGRVDEMDIVTRHARGILTVGSDVKNVTPSQMNRTKELIGLLLSKLDEGERNELMQKLCLDAIPILDEVNPIYVSMAEELDQKIKAQKPFRISRKGSVSFRFRESL